MGNSPVWGWEIDYTERKTTNMLRNVNTWSWTFLPRPTWQASNPGSVCDFFWQKYRQAWGPTQPNLERLPWLFPQR